MCYFADINKLLVVFFDKFDVSFNQRIEEYDGLMDENIITNFIDSNSKKYICIRNTLNACKMVGYFG